MLLAEIPDGEDVGKNAHDLSQEPQRNERGDPVRFTDRSYIPFIARYLGFDKSVPVVLATSGKKTFRSRQFVHELIAGVSSCEILLVRMNEASA